MKNLSSNSWKRCCNIPLILVDRASWYKAVLNFIKLPYQFIRFGERNIVEGFFRTLKEAARRFHLNFPGGIRRLLVFLELFRYWHTRDKETYELKTSSHPY